MTKRECIAFEGVVIVYEVQTDDKWKFETIKFLPVSNESKPYIQQSKDIDELIAFFETLKIKRALANESHN